MKATVRLAGPAPGQPVVELRGARGPVDAVWFFLEVGCELSDILVTQDPDGTWSGYGTPSVESL